MSKSSSKVDKTPGQLTFFDLLSERDQASSQQPGPGSMNVSVQLRECLSEAIRASGLSRYEVAGRMSELLGAEITKARLDTWTAESHDQHRFPAEYMAAFCEATGSHEPLHLVARLVRCHVFESEDALLADLGRIDQVRRELTRREKQIRAFLERDGKGAV